jgi:predicted 3-demethylubiquinone-9 3-methyltransferase (glyoxalase superfamily)
MGLNGGDHFTFNEAVSFVITCKDQEEINSYWNKLIANGGSEGNCGWCKDKYGLSWQVIPAILGELMSNPDKEQRVIRAFLKMKKIDIEILNNVNSRIFS